MINIYPKDEADGFAGRFSEIYRSSYDGGGLSTPFLSALAPIFIRDKNRTREIFRQGVSSKLKKKGEKRICFHVFFSKIVTFMIGAKFKSIRFCKHETKF